MDQAELEGLVNLVLSLTEVVVGVADVNRDVVVECLLPLPEFLHKEGGVDPTTFAIEMARQAASYGLFVRDVVDAFVRESVGPETPASLLLQ